MFRETRSTILLPLLMVLAAAAGCAAPAFAQDASGSPVDLGALLKFVWSGPNAYAYALLNVWVIAGMRATRMSQSFAYIATSAIGALLGVSQGIIQAQAAAGVNTAILSGAVLVGLVVGAGSATLIGLVIGKLLEAAGYEPSPQKQQAEAIRDPLNPAQPPVTGGN